MNKEERQLTNSKFDKDNDQINYNQYNDAIVKFSLLHNMPYKSSRLINPFGRASRPCIFFFESFFLNGIFIKILDDFF
jgi:hypothetical protein